MAEPRNLGRYELRRVLGKGAMGVVYEGFDPALNRRVAVKTILKSAIADEETASAYVARFAREAKAVARLNHPNIVQVHDFGDAGELAYLVMEFIEGRDLRACFEAGQRFAPAEAVRIMGELLSALDVAHESGVIHRDVKPANVMLDARRHVKLADFGVARLLDGTERSKTATMVGTPAFMSPEQIGGARVDRRTDLFSAGIVFYQLLTGEPPFKGDGDWTVAKAIVQDEPPRPSTLASTVSPLFDAVLSKALAKKPDQRFPSAREFAVAMNEAFAGRAAAAQSAPQASDTELEFWRSIQGSVDPAEFRLYLKNFPQGIYAELAQLKLSKLSAGAVSEPVPDAGEVSALSEQKAQLEAEIARREAEFRKREAEREIEDRARAEQAAKLEAEELQRIEATAKAQQEAVEAAKREALAELERKEAEFRQREAESRARAQAEARARAEAEARARQEAERLAAKVRAEAETRLAKEAAALARAKEEAEARARQAAEERARREAESAKREADAQQREAELRKQLAKAPGPRLAPLLIGLLLAAFAIAGGWYWYEANRAARLAELTAALDEAARASRQFDEAIQRQQSALRALDLARAREEEARKAGDLAKLKEAQDAAKRAEAEAAKQAELVKQKEAEKLAADKAATAKASADKAAADKLAAQRAAADRLAAEKAAAEKAAAEKATAERAAVEKVAADKAAAEKAAAEKRATEKLAMEKSAAPKAARPTRASGLELPGPGERWIYSVQNADIRDQKYEAVLEVKSADASGVTYAFQATGKLEVILVQRPGAHSLRGVAPGLRLMSPYLMYYEKPQPGDFPGLDSGASGCGGGSNCQFYSTVAGKERISVRAGTFQARKIEFVRVAGTSGNRQRQQFTYWFDEDTGVLVKYQRRLKEATADWGGAYADPDLDMELVARVSPAAPGVGGSGSRLPTAGDRWTYEVRETEPPNRVFEIVETATEVKSDSISAVWKIPGAEDVSHVYKPGGYMGNLMRGLAPFSPHVLSFEELRVGKTWDSIDSAGACGYSCSVSAAVVGKERIVVRAGSYDAWKVRFQWTLGQTFSSSREIMIWYAPEIKGIVKLHTRYLYNTARDATPPTFDMELLSYLPAK